jgi:hypothetical protein
MATIEQLKGEISRGGGVALANRFRVILPVIPEIYLNQTSIGASYPQSLNVLCKSCTMPGRQIMTVDRTVGVVNQKVAYGYATEDVNFSFTGLNNYIVRKYFEDWQFYIMNPDTHVVKYKNEYAKTVTIQQLDKRNRVVYSVNLEKAFPTQLLNIDFSNENNQPIDINVTMTFTRWSRNELDTDIVSDLRQTTLENILLN